MTASRSHECDPFPPGPSFANTLGDLYRLSCSRYGSRKYCIVPNRDGITSAPQPTLFASAGKHPRVVGQLPFASWQLWIASPICFRLFWDDIRLAASRTFWTAGSSRPIRMAMMAMTTNSSISVNPRRLALREELMRKPQKESNLIGNDQGLYRACQGGRC